MSSIDATSEQQKEAEPVPVKHPRWCDRSLCTAPEFQPTESNRDGGAHRSANLAALGDWASHDAGDVLAYLHQTVALWDCDTYLVINDIHMRISWDSPLLWAVLDQHDEIKARFPSLIARGREAAQQQIAVAKGARS